MTEEATKSERPRSQKYDRIFADELNEAGTKLKKSVQFLCRDSKQLTMVMHGGAPGIPARYHYFHPGPYGGFTRTDDPEIVQFIRAHIKTKEGKVVETEDPAHMVLKTNQAAVKQGGLGTGPDKPEPVEAPQSSVAGPVRAAKTPEPAF